MFKFVNVGKIIFLGHFEQFAVIDYHKYQVFYNQMLDDHS